MIKQLKSAVLFCMLSLAGLTACEQTEQVKPELQQAVSKDSKGGFSNPGDTTVQLHTMGFYFIEPYVDGKTFAIGQSVPLYWKFRSGQTGEMNISIGGGPNNIKRRLATKVYGIVDPPCLTCGDPYWTHTVTIPNDLPSGNNYWFELENISIYGGHGSSTGSGNFSIENPSCRGVISPNGGEHWAIRSSTQTITWCPERFGSSKVIIELYLTGSFMRYLAYPGTENDGIATLYTSTGLPGSQTGYKVKIISADNPDIYDFSNNGFGIY